MTAEPLLARTALVPELSPLSQAIVVASLIASIAFIVWLIRLRRKV